MAIGVFPSKNIVEVSTCGEGGEGEYARVYGDEVAWVGVVRGGGAGVKNK